MRQSAGTSDPVGLALASIGLGATVGAAIMCAGLFVLRLIQQGAGPGQHVQLEFAVLTGAIFVGVAAAVIVSFRATGAIEDLWRRGVASAIAVFGAVLLATVSAPVDLAIQTPGLVAYVLLLIVGAAWFARAVRRAAAR